MLEQLNHVDCIVYAMGHQNINFVYSPRPYYRSITSELMHICCRSIFNFEMLPCWSIARWSKLHVTLEKRVCI
jgi:hypothetical protein